MKQDRRIAPMLKWILWVAATPSVLALQSNQPGKSRSVVRSAVFDNEKNSLSDPINSTRRSVLGQVLSASVGAVLIASPGKAMAGEVGARITQAVTQSELGVSVRRSVVRGAQIMDGIDGQWEKFSDRFGLGSARKQQPGRPGPKIIPDPKPLDSSTAFSILSISDQSFCKCTQTSPSDLERQVKRVRENVGPSFLRSGLTPEEVRGEDETGSITTRQFNFLCYCHFKAYSDIIIERKIDFRSFKTEFESLVGKQIVTLFRLNNPFDSSITNMKLTPEQLLRQLNKARELVDRMAVLLVEKGLVAQVDSSPNVLTASDEQDALNDWLEDVSSPDLEWSIALDGDITQNCQILLQEQGYRLYPNFGRYAVQSILRSAMQGQAKVDITDYYMDTDYNSDPDEFEVKEVLLNIVLERTS